MNTAVKELYALKRKVDESVVENFGYCPNDDYFNALEKEWRDKEFVVKHFYPKQYQEYIKTAYS